MAGARPGPAGAPFLPGRGSALAKQKQKGRRGQPRVPWQRLLSSQREQKTLPQPPLAPPIPQSFDPGMLQACMMPHYGFERIVADPSEWRQQGVSLSLGGTPNVNVTLCGIA